MRGLSYGVAWWVCLTPLLGACASTLETEARMFRHFTEGREIHNAAVFGQLDRARAAAARLAEEGAVPGVSPGPALTSFYRAVDAVRRTDDPSELPARSAALADRCGSCHEARDAGPLYGFGRVREGEGVKGHMVVHAWASDRLWESIVARSEEGWADGAMALSGAPIEADEFIPMVPDRDTAFRLSSLTHELATSSVAAEGWEERTELLARLSGTCLQCHVLAGVR